MSSRRPSLRWLVHERIQFLSNCRAANIIPVVGLWRFNELVIGGEDVYIKGVNPELASLITTPDFVLVRDALGPQAANRDAARVRQRPLG